MASIMYKQLNNNSRNAKCRIYEHLYNFLSKKKYLSILEISENNRRENNRYNQGWIREFSKRGPNYLSIYLNIVIINKTHRLTTIVRKTFDTLVTN